MTREKPARRSQASLLARSQGAQDQSIWRRVGAELRPEVRHRVKTEARSSSTEPFHGGPKFRGALRIRRSPYDSDIAGGSPPKPFLSQNGG